MAVKNEKGVLIRQALMSLFSVTVGSTPHDSVLCFFPPPLRDHMCPDGLIATGSTLRSRFAKLEASSCAHETK